MSWNEIKVRPGVKLFNNLNTNAKFYFAHSFHFIPEDINSVVAESYYGDKFIAAVENCNILGVQFHPEKSHKFGMRLLTNFLSEY
jgi:glutamine amidotransferase